MLSRMIKRCGAILDGLPYAVVALDIKYGFLWANRKAEQLFPGIGQSRDKHIPDSLAQRFKEFFTAGDSYIHEIAGGRYECRVSKIEGRPGGYFLSFTDVSRLFGQLVELERQKDEALAASSAKSAYLANMSHELRTPLNSIIGISGLALRSEIDEGQRGNLECILRSGQELLEALNDILDLSKIEANRFELYNEEYDLRDILNDAYTLCVIRLAERPVRFHILINGDMPQSYIGDARRIKEILMNLLSNALKYTNEGSIQLVAGTETAGDGLLLKFTVEDTGIGIKDEDLGIIFDSYMQADSKSNRSIQGTGLGLAITKKLVGLMGGTISVSSRYGIGTSFCVSLPQPCVGEARLKGGEYIPESRFPGRPPRACYAGSKALVVDDMEVNLQVTAELLKSYGLDVDCAGGGEEAVRLAGRVRYDIIFMDYLMPGMDGIEAARQIKELVRDSGRSVRVVALTANFSKDKHFFIGQGFDGFLLKPVGEEMVEKLLADFLTPASGETRRVHKLAHAALKEIDFSALRACGITPEDGMRSSGVDAEFYVTVLSSFIDSFRDCDFERLSGEDPETFRIKVHGVKGVALAIGANTLALESKLLEKSSSAHDYEAVRRQLPSFLQCFRQVNEGIAGFLKSQEP